MKTKKIEIIVGSLVGLASSVAHSQSSVTLYGEIDNGIHYQTNVGGGKAVYMDSLDGIDGSRWGLTGKEDLGGGLKAIFTLESGINVNNGQFAQGGTAFGRQAFVGLSSDTYGSLTAGRQYDMVWYFPEFLAGSAAVGDLPSAHPGDFDNTSNSVRFNNSVRYMSPDFRGFSFGVEYSLGGVPGDFTSTSGYSLGVGYTHGPLQIGAAFDYFKHPTSTPGNGWFTNYASGFNLLASSLNSAYQVAQAYQDAVIAAAYTIGNATISASYSNVQYANLGAGFMNGTAVFNNYDIGLNYRVTPVFFVGVAYDYMNARSVTTAQGNAVGDQHYNQVAFTLDYLLSKRTDVYFSGGWQRASGTSSTGAPAVANIGGSGDSSNNHQMVYRLAIRHKF
ncbi:porin [Burkholderia vietnamiensis]|uniref:porin n=1 Tax=Burkholderia vietnamiensis TaxID=60552 RepID=UPI001CF4EDF0|nr:porin [Burkholderia vietnamiensis]MCA8227734.1 porin [Burkholderia vietnamiensis]